MEEKKKNKKKITIALISIIVLMIIGISYALLRKTIYGESGKIILHGGEIDVILEEDSIPDLTLKKAIPTKDEDGVQSEDVYRFSVVNNSDTDVTYKVYLDNDEDAISRCGDDCGLLEDKDVKYEIRKGSNATINTLETRELGEGRVNKNKKDTYELRLWLDIDAGNDAMGKNFFGKIRVEVVQTLEKEPPTGTELFLADHVNDEAIQDYDLEYTKEDPTAKENKMYVFDHASNKGSQQSDWSSDELKDYRYIGADPNNYVTFNGEQAGWRIIGIETVEDETGKREKRIKLIRKDSLTPDMSWDNKPSGTGSSESEYGSNDWYDSRLMYLLNPSHESETTGVSGSIYWNRQSGKCPRGQNNATTTCDFSEVGLLPEAQKMIGDAKWYLGGTDEYDSVDTGTVYHWYSDERGEKTCITKGICSNPRKINWTGRVGLMYPSDYGYATSGGTSKTREACLSDAVYNYDAADCKNNDWLYNGENQWTIAPRSGGSGFASDIISSGSVYYVNVNFLVGVRPVVYLKANTIYQSGDGSESNPFVLSVQ